MIRLPYFSSTLAPAKSLMFMRRMQAILMLALLSVPLLGCRAWQPIWPVVAEKQAKSHDTEAGNEVDKPRSRTTGRSPIKPTGINEQSREIERNLGAR